MWLVVQRNQAVIVRGRLLDYSWMIVLLWLLSKVLTTGWFEREVQHESLQSEEKGLL